MPVNQKMIGDYLNSFPTAQEVDKSDPDWIEFASKLDEIDLYIKDKIDDLDLFLDFERCPTQFLERLGRMFKAGILKTDSDLLKRSKIRYAIQSHKFAGTFTKDVKLILDVLAGGDSSIYSAGFENFGKWVWVSKPIPAYDLSYNSCFAHTLYEPELGMVFNIGTTGFPYVPGVVLIDVDNPSLTTEQLDQIEYELLQHIPMYMCVYLGYISGGNFIVYRVLQHPLG